MGTNSKTTHKPSVIVPATAGPKVRYDPVKDSVPAEDPAENPPAAVVGELPDPGPVADALTPVPEAPPEGAAAGIPVLAGGEDLIDSTLTLMSYASPGGPREVLLATVTEDAEAKLMDALGVSDEKMVPVQVQQEVTGRLPLDEQKQLHELVAKVLPAADVDRRGVVGGGRVSVWVSPPGGCQAGSCRLW